MSNVIHVGYRLVVCIASMQVDFLLFFQQFGNWDKFGKASWSGNFRTLKFSSMFYNFDVDCWHRIVSRITFLLSWQERWIFVRFIRFFCIFCSLHNFEFIYCQWKLKAFNVFVFLELTLYFFYIVRVATHFKIKTPVYSSTFSSILFNLSSILDSKK